MEMKSRVAGQAIRDESLPDPQPDDRGEANRQLKPAFDRPDRDNAGAALST
jgi:hypothetical protein